MSTAATRTRDEMEVRCTSTATSLTSRQLGAAMGAGGRSAVVVVELALTTRRGERLWRWSGLEAGERVAAAVVLANRCCMRRAAEVAAAAAAGGAAVGVLVVVGFREGGRRVRVSARMTRRFVWCEARARRQHAIGGGGGGGITLVPQVIPLTDAARRRAGARGERAARHGVAWCVLLWSALCLACPWWWRSTAQKMYSRGFAACEDGRGEERVRTVTRNRR